MKKAKRLIVVVALALAFVLSLAVIAACGGTKLDKGSYQGTYKITFTENGETKHYGCTAAFEVDESNCVWNLANSAPDADWTGAAEGDKYVAPAIASGPPWNANKATSQFSGWTVDEIMAIKIAVDSNGRPTGKGCIESKKEITIGVDCDEGIAFLILAVQDGIKTANKV